MNRMRLWASAAIIVVVILVTFALSVPHTRDVAEKMVSPEATASVPAITLRDSFKKGVHTISGSVEAPNACAVVSAVASVIGNASTTEGLPAMPAHAGQAGILVAITTETDSGICLQVPTLIRFETTITAPSALPISVTMNGLYASTTPS